MNKRYVGIDLSSKTGFVIQDAQGKIIFEDDIVFEYTKDPERMIFICDEILKHLNLETDIICIENFSYNSKGASGSYQYGIGFIVRENLVRHGFSYYDIAPTAVKKFATNHGQAKKELMIKPVEKRWGFYHPSDNIIDAFVLSEIAKAIDMGKEYPGLKQHEKEVVRKVKNGIMNKEEWKRTPSTPWKNPKSKYYFNREEYESSKNK